MNLDLFHFIRPEWLFALIPFVLLYIWLWRQQDQQSNWRKIIDPALIKHLLDNQNYQRNPRPLLILLLAGILSIVALAGPTWERLPRPVFRHDAAMVIVLDLSKSMDAQDIKPSRLQRAHFKIADILKTRKEGQTALVVYAADAFTVSPLTDDDETILSQLSALTTGLVPEQGSRGELAIQLANKLLIQASQTQGQVLLITDEIQTASGLEAAQQLTDAGHQLSILGIGTVEGAPIPIGDGMLKDSSGNIVIPRLDSSNLQRIAHAGGGHYATVTSDTSDIQQLKLAEPRGLADAVQQNDDLTADVWREFGPWLLLPVLPLAAFAFRRGLLVLALIMIIPWPQSAQAFEWRDLWQTKDQRGQDFMLQNQPKLAAESFADPAWRAGAHYQSKNYEAALQDYNRLEGPDARYNQGNTLARLGKLEDAIKAYDEVLRQDPKHEDAKFNKQLIEDQLKKQQQKEQQQPPDSNNPQQDQKSDSASAEDNSGGSSGQQSSPEEQQQPADSDSQPSQSDQSEQQHADTQKDSNPTEDNNRTEQQQASEQQSDSESGGNNKNMVSESDTINNPASEEEKLAQEQWLNRIPDDPSGLLRRKFEYQYKQRPKRYAGEQRW